MEMATQTCEVCGIEIVQTPKKKPKRFCSGKCRSAWWHQYHKEHYEEEGTRTRICEFCGKRFPIQWESAESRKYCSHECYINARYHSSEKDVTGQFTEAATLVASAIDHLDDAEEGITDKLTRYSRNPYVRINLKKRRVEINALFQSAAVPFSDKVLGICHAVSQMMEYIDSHLPFVLSLRKASNSRCRDCVPGIRLENMSEF